MAQVKSKGMDAHEQNGTAQTFNANPAATNPNALYRDFKIPQDKFLDERTFVIAGIAFMESRKIGGVKTDLVACKLPDPFGDPDFIDVTVCPKWANSGGIFKYRAKKALRSVSELRFPIVVTPVTFYSKKAKRELTIAGLYAKTLLPTATWSFMYIYRFRKSKRKRLFSPCSRPRSGISSWTLLRLRTMTQQNKTALLTSDTVTTLN